MKHTLMHYKGSTTDPEADYSRGVTFPSSIFTAVARAPIRRTLRFSKSASSYRAAIDSHYASRIAERAFPFWLILANCFADSASCN